MKQGPAPCCRRGAPAPLPYARAAPPARRQRGPPRARLFIKAPAAHPLPAPLPPFAAPPAPAPLLVAAATAAAAGPALLAYNVSPSSTFLNQALALALWAAFVAVGALVAPPPPRGAVWRAAAWPGLALLLVLAAVAWSWGPGSLPSGLALSAAGMLLAAGLLLLAGAAAGGGAAALPLFTAFCIGWVVAGVLNAAIGTVQVFAPAWPDGNWIARSGLAGRAVGNLRQPNHLSSLLLWAAIAVVPLAELGRLRRRTAFGLMLLLVYAVVLTASRTGVVGVGLLAAWGLLDRRLSRAARALLLAAPLMYLLAWAGLAAWAEWGRHAFGGEARLAEADLSGSRFGIWANTIALIRQQPWAGVGFGEFNLAWTLTPFPGRPTAYFDHAHNLPLHLAAELGLPLAAVSLGLLCAALWRALRAPPGAAPADAVMQRSAGMMLLLIGLHSLLEYPLWYAYFLLPTAWIFGFALARARAAGATGGAPGGEAAGAAGAAAGAAGAAAGAVPAAAGAAAGAVPGAAAGSAAGAEAGAKAGASGLRALLLAGAAALALGSVAAVADYARVAAIYVPTGGGASLAQRIEAGRRSWFFAHHADYADVTTLHSPALPPAFTEAPHYLLDGRLMGAWAQALAAEGRLDEARHLAARLREFGGEAADELFAPCAAAPAPAKPSDLRPEPAAEPAPAPDAASKAVSKAASKVASKAATAPLFAPPLAPSRDPLPWQCTPPTRLVPWRDFVR